MATTVAMIRGGGLLHQVLGKCLLDILFSKKFISCYSYSNIYRGTQSKKVNTVPQIPFPIPFSSPETAKNSLQKHLKYNNTNAHILCVY